MIGWQLVLLPFIFCADLLLSQTYTSPDRAISADVVIASPTDCESKVVIHDHERTLMDVSYVSADHDHGKCVDMAKWSRDSQFFVYIMENAGGHQGWHSYIMIYSRAKGELLSLGNYIQDPITGAQFRLSGDHSIEFETTTVPWSDHVPPRKRRMDMTTLNIQEP
jgi:hypothetical protein